MRDFLEQIEAAARTNYYYLSLVGALMVPDICGALGSANGKASKDTYIRWFNEHIAPRYRVGTRQFFSGEDCYSFRCSFLHQGTTRNPKSSYSRIVFIEPSTSSGTIMHNNILNDALNLDINIFCSDVVQAARRWVDEVEGSEPYETNVGAFVRRYPGGLAPYVVGPTVIS